MLTAPYVTPAEFTAHPTYLDLDDLRNGNSDPEAQTAELVNLLLAASAWVDNTANQPVGAHEVTTTTRGRLDREGVLRVHAHHTPVLDVTSLAYGTTPFNLSPEQAPRWVVEGDSGNVAFYTGRQYPPGQWLTVQWSYVAGYVCTTLTEGSLAGATALTVTDPTGILPGGTYRLWEPGAEESVTVSADYTPPPVTGPPTVTRVPLAAPTRYEHTAGAGVSQVPADLRLAVILYTVSLLMRPDTAAEDSYPDTSLSSNTRSADPRQTGKGLVAEAERIVASYARIR